jgi:hypothetical protein
MSNVKETEIDIAKWVASIIPSDLWDRNCHLTYAQMAEVPELGKYTDELRKADSYWYRMRKTSHY